jgi:hypothetical protein
MRREGAHHIAAAVEVEHDRAGVGARRYDPFGRHAVDVDRGGRHVVGRRQGEGVHAGSTDLDGDVGILAPVGPQDAEQLLVLGTGHRPTLRQPGYRDGRSTCPSRRANFHSPRWRTTTSR